MKLIHPILLSSLLLLGLTACSPSKESQATVEPKATADQNTQTPETSNTDSTEHVPFTDKSFLENGADAEQAQELSQEPPLQEEFEVRVRRDESQYSMTGYVDKLNIMSLNNDPTSLTNISINRGNCRAKGFYDYQNMRYGSVAQVYLGCAAENVREVTITTNSGLTYTYNFQAFKTSNSDTFGNVKFDVMLDETADRFQSAVQPIWR